MRRVLCASVCLLAVVALALATVVTAAPAPAVLARPMNLTASQGDYPDRVALAWSLETGPDVIAPLTFSIYRDSNLVAQPEVLASGLSHATRAFTDRTALPNQHYVYWVESVRAGYQGQASIRAEGWATDCVPIEAPALLSPPDGALFWADAAGGSEHQLNWTRPPGVDRFIKETYDDGTGALLERLTLDNNHVFIHFFAEEGLYRWRVRALSPVAGCDPSPWSGFWRYAIRQIHAYPVLNLRATQGTLPDRVRLTWTLDDRPREGFVAPERFIVQRAASLTGERVRLAYVDREARSYEDRSAQPGVSYVYWVISHNEMVFDTTSDPAYGWAGAPLFFDQALYLPLVYR